MTAAGTECISCGTAPTRADARFCDACGAALGPAGLTAEFKQVTVLFADVVHSMDIAAALGPERLREVMAELVNRSSAVVSRYGGTVDKFTGDGIMAVFGAPVALEDHAVRACLAALGIQAEATRLAAEVEGRDGIALQLRVGLNSGQVIAGEVGSHPLGYTAVGEQVGLAQRMESVAPPGGVMLSESTARLVEHAATMAELESVHIKGSDVPVSARLLLSVEHRGAGLGRTETTLVGRQWEKSAIDAMLKRAVAGRGGVVGVVGPPGIGKSRLLREVAATAAADGVEVISTFCESHAREIPFHAVARLLKIAMGVSELGAPAARAHIRARLRDADSEDLQLLDDLLGIADPDGPLPTVDPDARRRRLTALIDGALLARTQPVVYLIEDAHWIDEVSETMLADFLAVVPRTHSLVLITHRPEYRGRMVTAPDAQSIALAPLDDSETSALLTELLGSHESVQALAATVAARADGNPFFVQEIVRDLAERGVLQGRPGGYVCDTDGVEVTVPSTLQATIAARIDRLSPQAKRLLSGAAVIGSRFGTELFGALGLDPVFDDLLGAQLFDQVMFTPRAEYAFHHPMIRAVAYQAQLRSARAELHRRLAAAMEDRDPASVDENSSLIAEHLEAAGEVRAAYGWHMRAGAWATNRHIAAARISWERARQIADALPDDDPNGSRMRIAARTMLCGTGWRVHVDVADRFDELRELCDLAGDKSSLAIGLTGVVAEHMYYGRVREASRAASEQLALLDSIGDPVLTVAVAFVSFVVKYNVDEADDLFRVSTSVIDAAGGDPSKGDLIMGSPLALALVWRGIGGWWLGRTGWRQDLDDAIAIAKCADPLTHATVVSQRDGFAVTSGVLRADDALVRELEEAIRGAERLGDDTAMGLVKYALGGALLERDEADRDRGLELMVQLRDMCLDGRFYLSELHAVEAFIAREHARRGEWEAAIPALRDGVHALRRAGQRAYEIGMIGYLVEVLLQRGADADVAEAEEAVERLARMNSESAVRDVSLLRLRALLARAHDDDASYRDWVGRYRAVAESLGFEGHLDRAEAMAADPGAG